MRHLAIILAISSLSYSHSLRAQCRIDYSAMTLAFEDDFNYSSLSDLYENWQLTQDYHTSPNSNPDTSIFVNYNNPNELSYTDPLYAEQLVEFNGSSIVLKTVKLASPYVFKLPESVSPELIDLYEEYNNIIPRFNPADSTVLYYYARGGLQSNNSHIIDLDSKNILGNSCYKKTGFRYGYHEAKFRIINACWPAYWLYSDPDEIDIFERAFQPEHGNNKFTNGQIYHGGSHPYYDTLPGFSNEKIKCGEFFEVANGEDLGEDWITMGLLYTEEFVAFYYNGVELYRSSNVNTVQCPLDIKFGNSVSIECGIEEESYQIEIDYIRFYRFNDSLPANLDGVVFNEKLVHEDSIQDCDSLLNDGRIKLGPVGNQIFLQLDDLMYTYYLDGGKYKFAELVQNPNDEHRLQNTFKLGKGNSIYYISKSNNFNRLFWNGSLNRWDVENLDYNLSQQDICDIDKGEASIYTDQYFYVTCSGWIANYYTFNGIWSKAFLTSSFSPEENSRSKFILLSENNTIVYVNQDNNICLYIWNGISWDFVELNSLDDPNEKVGIDNKIVISKDGTGKIFITYQNIFGNIGRYSLDGFSTITHDILYTFDGGGIDGSAEFLGIGDSVIIYRGLNGNLLWLNRKDSIFIESNFEQLFHQENVYNYRIVGMNQEGHVLSIDRDCNMWFGSIRSNGDCTNTFFKCDRAGKYQNPLVLRNNNRQYDKAIYNNNIKIKDFGRDLLVLVDNGGHELNNKQLGMWTVYSITGETLYSSFNEANSLSLDNINVLISNNIYIITFVSWENKSIVYYKKYY